MGWLGFLPAAVLLSRVTPAQPPTSHRGSSLPMQGHTQVTLTSLRDSSLPMQGHTQVDPPPPRLVSPENCIVLVVQ
jgi:hypothetical protein